MVWFCSLRFSRLLSKGNPLWSPGRNASKAARLLSGLLGPLLKSMAPRNKRSALAEMASAPVRARMVRRHFNDFIIVLIDMVIVDSTRPANRPVYPQSRLKDMRNYPE